MGYDLNRFKMKKYYYYYSSLCNLVLKLKPILCTLIRLMNNRIIDFVNWYIPSLYFDLYIGTSFIFTYCSTFILLLSTLPTDFIKSGSVFSRNSEMKTEGYDGSSLSYSRKKSPFLALILSKS